MGYFSPFRDEPTGTTWLLLLTKCDSEGVTLQRMVRRLLAWLRDASDRVERCDCGHRWTDPSVLYCPDCGAPHRLTSSVRRSAVHR